MYLTTALDAKKKKSSVASIKNDEFEDCAACLLSPAWIRQHRMKRLYRRSLRVNHLYGPFSSVRLRVVRPPGAMGDLLLIPTITLQSHRQCPTSK
ncbi:hypothetical protein KC331_g53 [Hortaea werneckii]|nr:hypothetical protein KC331_g53 [Hortaea werneckii]